MDTIAAFDFDGTITRKDSFLDFLLYTFGAKYVFKRLFFDNFFILLCYYFGLASNHKAKEHIFCSIFKDYAHKDFENLCSDYSLNRVNEIIRPEAISRIKWHLVHKHTLVLISASIKEWIAPWAEQYGFEMVIATEPEVREGILTGRFKTKNCYGEEKRKRFLEIYPRRNSYLLLVYGDSRGDKALMGEADKAFYRIF
ncbi:MAG TPA: HAD-IB family hydrolase [Syntrophales bacterium]|nr:HAD-IB family hydrolase [Syntrophales bacterium]HOM08409.1 HAD-IB family hydrolase [Syntrophales bacterium]HOO00985.1 HAD-IB family hydrolase [Syntrophales bacterium]